MIERVDAPDGDSFDVLWNGKKVMYASREHLTDGRRGHWLMYLDTLAGPMIVERDQYSNDLMERAAMHCSGERPYGGLTSRFRVKCSKEQYLNDVLSWLMDLGFEFGGDWTSDYYEWEGSAVLFRKVS